MGTGATTHAAWEDSWEDYCRRARGFVLEQLVQFVSWAGLPEVSPHTHLVITLRRGEWTHGVQPHSYLAQYDVDVCTGSRPDGPDREVYSYGEAVTALHGAAWQAVAAAIDRAGRSIGPAVAVWSEHPIAFADEVCSEQGITWSPPYGRFRCVTCDHLLDELELACHPQGKPPALDGTPAAAVSAAVDVKLTMEQRTRAEDDVATVLRWRDEHLALLYQALRRGSWTDDHARLVLKKVGWLL